MWKPIEYIELFDEILLSEKKMSLRELRYWDAIKIEPNKWSQEKYGDQGGGFWVVGVYGNHCIWYNDIEGGFNTSSYQIYGAIGEYWCNQDELLQQVQNLISMLDEI